MTTPEGASAGGPGRSDTVIRRTTGRVLPVNPDGRVLLLHGWDPRRPDEPFWFTVGGAADDGESLRDAAARELREEAGITIDPARLGDPIASNTIEFSWGGWWFVQQQTFFVVAVGAVEVSFDGQDEWERSSIDRHGWFSASEVLADPDPVHPEIPALITAAVASVAR
ncbi:MAG TPA: NUDIX domain-containing protein [Streptosporangiaceae bacterium]